MLQVAENQMSAKIHSSFLDKLAIWGDLRNQEWTYCVNVWEVPPSGEGITAFTLNILENYMGHNTADSLHVLTEAMKLSFTDALSICADSDKACNYFTVVDPQGSAGSFIKCNCMGFGTGLIPDGGFTLQGRKYLPPLKMPCTREASYHTVSPTPTTAAGSEELLCSFRMMGEFVQLQGQVQVLLNMLAFGMNPQEALGAAWFCLNTSKTKGRWCLSLQDNISAVVEDLRAEGHWSQWPVSGHNSLFGHSLIISRGSWWNLGTLSSRHLRKVLWAGSDPGDGCTMEYYSGMNMCVIMPH
ncbi:LOW QUALITY PROTEIN: glutathione hydrolase-like YwrD proenzyme [Chlamydotis macqueenii]